MSMQTQTQVMPQLLTIDQVAETLSVSRRSVYNLIYRGELPPPLRILGRARFTVTEIQAFIERSRPND